MESTVVKSGKVANVANLILATLMQECDHSFEGLGTLMGAVYLICTRYKGEGVSQEEMLKSITEMLADTHKGMGLSKYEISEVRNLSTGEEDLSVPTPPNLTLVH